jgi:hypothetical protein
MYSIRIIAEGVKVPDESGVPTVVPIGTIITDKRAWIHCLPGFRNRPPIAVPADEVTAAKVTEERERLEPRRRAYLAHWQRKINAFAADAKKYPLGSDGNFLRDKAGELSGRWSNEDRHIAELAQAHGLKPVVGSPAVAAVAAVAEPVSAVFAATGIPKPEVTVFVPAVSAVASAVPVVTAAEPATAAAESDETA